MTMNNSHKKTIDIFLDIQNLTKIQKHSVRISGHQTSITLENIFWILLKHIAKIEQKSINQIITEVDKNRNGNLSSALRTYILLAQSMKNIDILILLQHILADHHPSNGQISEDIKI